MDDNTLRDLFGSAPAAGIVVASGLNVSKDMFAKVYLLRLITAVMLRASLVASVWLFIFDPDKWIGMLLFFILGILFGGVQSFNATSKGKAAK